LIAVWVVSVIMGIKAKRFTVAEKTGVVQAKQSGPGPYQVRACKESILLPRSFLSRETREFPRLRRTRQQQRRGQDFLQIAAFTA